MCREPERLARRSHRPRGVGPTQIARSTLVTSVERTGAENASTRKQLLTVLDVPHLERPVVTAADPAFAVGTERHAGSCVRVSLRRDKLMSRRCVPHLYFTRATGAIGPSSFGSFSAPICGAGCCCATHGCVRCCPGTAS